MAQPLSTITTLYLSSDSICMNSYCSILTQSGGTDSIFHTLLLVRQHLRENSQSHPHTWFRDHWPSPHCTPFHHTLYPISAHRTPFQTSAWNPTAQSWHNCWHRHHYSIIPLVRHHLHNAHYSGLTLVRYHCIYVLIHYLHNTYYSVLTQAQTPYLQYFPWHMSSAWHPLFCLDTSTNSISAVFPLAYVICLTPTILFWHKHRLYIYSISPVVCHLHNIHYTLSILTQTAHSITTIFPLEDGICITPVVSS